ncbi:MAG: ASCH domain-containing protein [Firmicutes bacterium]|nr:ASCH domain-containing protein [Bacillota bacterium]
MKEYHMKALTIKQPWASLIVDGYKKYEFRSWKTNYRGKILIHAGLSLEKDMMERFKDYNLNCTLGAIIGEAELVDCILVDENFNEELRTIDPIVYGRSNHVENYAWKLENIKKYDEPIYIKGKLGLWNYNTNNE